MGERIAATGCVQVGHGAEQTLTDLTEQDRALSARLLTRCVRTPRRVLDRFW